MNTSEPPKIIDTKHTSPVATVIATVLGGTTATAADLEFLLAPVAQEPRLNVGDGNWPVACDPAFLVAGRVSCGCPR